MLFKTSGTKVTRKVDIGKAGLFTSPAAFMGNLMASNQNGTSSMTRALIATLAGAGLGPLVGLSAMNMGGGIGGAQLASLGSGAVLAYTARKILDRMYEPADDDESEFVDESESGLKA